MINTVFKEPCERFFTEDELKNLIQKEAERTGASDTLWALPFAEKAHGGQIRKNSDVPYFNHPLMVCAHAMSLGIREDAIWSACLLHDVLEDCDYTKEELPVSEEARELVVMLSHGDKDDKEAMAAYFRKIAENPKASLIKCIDRVNNLSTISWGLSKKRQIRYIIETENDIMPLAKGLMENEEYRQAGWMLFYQMGALADTIKRHLLETE